MIKGPEMESNLVGGHIIAGYRKFRPEMPDVEMEILPILIAARFAQSLVMGEHYYAHDPSNEYVLVTASSGGWETLRDFWSLPREKLFQNWQEIVDSYEIK